MPDPKPKTKNINKPTAVQKLGLSSFSIPNQMEGLTNDISIDNFKLQMRNKAGINIISTMTEATIERTISGASTLTVTIDDAWKQVMNSGRLGRRVDVNVDGLWFTLVAVAKSERRLTLTFEEREVNVLRYYDTFLMADRNTMTRAQFVLKMIQEVKEFRLDFIIPELDVITTPTDARQSNQIVVDQTGTPLFSPDDPTGNYMNRSGGIYTGVKGLTVQGVPATNEQITNANLVLSMGVSMHASRKVLVSSIMTAIQESWIKNLSHADSDPTPGTTSSGVFQQQQNGSWPASGDVSTDAAGYFRAAMSVDKSSPNLSLNDLCQGTQHSGTPYAYGKWESEANKIVDAFGVAGAAPTAAVGTQPGQTSNNQKQTSDSIQDAGKTKDGNYYTRGIISQAEAQSKEIILTKENSWDCMKRLADEVNWACFVVSGTVYFVSEKWLFKSKPFMSISEDSSGVDWIDYDYDEGKREATITVSCHLSRWSAPPGSIVSIYDMGIVNGRWIVRDISRSLFDTQGTITLSKPRPVLPEPTTLTTLPSGFTGNDNASTITGASGPMEGVIGGNEPMNDLQKQVISYAMGQLGVPYHYGGESPGVEFDCSGLTHASYTSVGIFLSRTAYGQLTDGPLEMGPLRPGDLLFYGNSPPSETSIHHVAMYIGNGKMIEAPHTGAVVRAVPARISGDYYAATSPWTKSASSDNRDRGNNSHHGGKNG